MCEQRGLMNSIRVVYENEASILSQRVCKLLKNLKISGIYVTYNVLIMFLEGYSFKIYIVFVLEVWKQVQCLYSVCRLLWCDQCDVFWICIMYILGTNKKKKKKKKQFLAQLHAISYTYIVLLPKLSIICTDVTYVYHMYKCVICTNACGSNFWSSYLPDFIHILLINTHRPYFFFLI